MKLNLILKNKCKRLRSILEIAFNLVPFIFFNYQQTRFYTFFWKIDNQVRM